MISPEYSTEPRSIVIYCLFGKLRHCFGLHKATPAFARGPSRSSSTASFKTACFDSKPNTRGFNPKQRPVFTRGVQLFTSSCFDVMAYVAMTRANQIGLFPSRSTFHCCPVRAFGSKSASTFTSCPLQQDLPDKLCFRKAATVTFLLRMRRWL